ncbi:MAG: TIGR04283 family arsenosugar biosynthesis glycosyltransferase [Sedimenticola sp.]
MMRISLVIPCLNEGQGVVPLLRSLQPLRKLGHEVILVDGGSSDSSCDLVIPLVDQLIVTARGRARQMNAGAAEANGDLLWFLHADTVLSVGVIDALQQLPLAPALVWGRFDVKLSGSHKLLRVVELMMNLRSRLSGIATGDQGIFVQTELFRAVDGFADIPLMEDIALSKRLKALAPPLCLRQRLITSSRRWEQHGIFKTIFLMWRLRLAYAMGADPSHLAKLYH